MDTKDTLLAYSEWLDSEGLVSGEDARSHEVLASEFVHQWESDPSRATLAGRDPVVGSDAPGEPYHHVCGDFHAKETPCRFSGD